MPQNPRILEFCIVQKCRSPNFEALFLARVSRRLLEEGKGLFELFLVESQPSSYSSNAELLLHAVAAATAAAAAAAAAVTAAAAAAAAWIYPKIIVLITDLRVFLSFKKSACIMKAGHEWI